MKYRLCFLLLLLLFCCVMLKRYRHSVFYQSPKKSPFHKASLFVWPSITPQNNQDFAKASDQPQEFTCSPSESTVIPRHLPQSYQDFLRYRHCRAFKTLLSPSLCEDDLYLLLAIKSTASHVERRAALRDTWGHAGKIQGRQVKLVFLMGRSHDQVLRNDLQSVLEWESRSHGDILQWDFYDTFLNLTRKEVQFLSWFSQSCNKAQFVFKGDDDVFVNTENLITFLSNYNPENNLFAGYIHDPELPIRDNKSKYFVPTEVFPEGKLYPRFPSGGGYLMSRQTVLGLDPAAKEMDLFPIDDVFLGMCLQQMGVDLEHHSGFLTFGLSHGQKQFGLCVHQEAMIVHKMIPLEMRVFWILKQDRQLCK